MEYKIMNIIKGIFGSITYLNCLFFEMS